MTLTSSGISDRKEQSMEEITKAINVYMNREDDPNPSQYEAVITRYTNLPLASVLNTGVTAEIDSISVSADVPGSNNDLIALSDLMPPVVQVRVWTEPGRFPPPNDTGTTVYGNSYGFPRGSVVTYATELRGKYGRWPVLMVLDEDGELLMRFLFESITQRYLTRFRPTGKVTQLVHCHDVLIPPSEVCLLYDDELMRTRDGAYMNARDIVSRLQREDTGEEVVAPVEDAPVEAKKTNEALASRFALSREEINIPGGSVSAYMNNLNDKRRKRHR